MSLKEIPYWDLKAYWQQLALTPQVIKVGETYRIFVASGPIEFYCLVPVEEPRSSELNDLEENVLPAGNAIQALEVVTLFEKADKIPRYASVSGEYDANGDCTLMVKVPGPFVEKAPTRYLSLAYFVSDVFGWGDMVTKIEITDEDNILNLGAGAVLDSLHDLEAPSENQGWYFYPTEGTSGELEFTPSDKFGEINGQLYLKAQLKRAPGSSASKVFVNIDWGAKRP